MEQIDKYIRIDSKIKYLAFVIIRAILLPIARLLYCSKKKWVICERGDDAQDNAYIFFKYLINKNKNIKPIFLIKKQSPDYYKVQSIGKTADFGSFKHFMLCIGSKVKISSNLYGYAPWIVMEKYFRRHKTNDIHVFLQHGIIKNFHPSFLAGCNKSLSLFITGALPEYKYVSTNYGYKTNVVFYSGLPRFDNLLNTNSCKKQLLIMPTWRAYLKGQSIEEFKKSTFYKGWMKLLKDPEFISICQKELLDIKFYLHHEMQPYLKAFSDVEGVHFVKYNESTVQQLLIDSALLITDYSSVFFDFAFLLKPIIFYQFDEDEYYSKHYEKGYFDYRKSNLGQVCTDANFATKHLKSLIDSNFAVSDSNLNAAKQYFVYHDDKNCERIYNQIVNLLEKR